MIRESWIYFVDLHSWSTKWALFLDWRMNASVTSPQGNLNLILFELELCIWHVTVDGPRSPFSLELEYQELARLEDNRVSCHVIVLYTECIHRHMIGFDLKVWLYFLILAIIKWISTNWNLENIFRQQSTTWQFQCPCNYSAIHNQKKFTNQLK